MKKSDIYKMAIAAVILDEQICMDKTIEIITELIKEKELAEFSEKREEAKA